MKNQKITLNCEQFLPGKQKPCTLLESITLCTRCNSCAQNCPAYFLKQEETSSPRGRAQLMRLLVEHPAQTKNISPAIKQEIASCFLCARCTSACAGQVPVAHYMLALQKEFSLPRLPFLLRKFFHFHTVHPVLFDKCSRLGLGLYKVKLLPLLRPLLPHWAKHALDVLPKKLYSLPAQLRQHHFAPTDKPGALYLPSLYAQYIDGRIGWRILEKLSAQNPHVLPCTASGLFEYLYGKEAHCLRTAKKLIKQWEKLSAGNELFIWTDSIEIYSFIKNYPILFSKFPNWKKRALCFSAHIKFITELNFPTASLPKKMRVMLDASSILSEDPKILEQAFSILRTHFDKNLVECEYGCLYVPVAGQIFWPQIDIGPLLYQTTKYIAQQQIARVYCLSGWAVLELNAALRRCCPAAQAKHFMDIETEYE